MVPADLPLGLYSLLSLRSPSPRPYLYPVVSGGFSMSRFIWQDVLAASIVFLNLGALFITNYLTSTISAYTSAANLLESDPAQRLLLNLGYLHFILQGVLYAILLTFYLYLRGNRNKGQVHKQVFIFIVLLFFILGLTDFGNDLSIVLGVLR